MKVIISILSYLIITANTIIAQDKTEKIQEELIAVIKKVYMNCSAEGTDVWERENSSRIYIKDSSSHFIESKENLTVSNSPHRHRFYDFKFKITSNQAVVEFKVDNFIKSAFLEKKDGTWELICAADLTPVL